MSAVPESTTKTPTDTGLALPANLQPDNPLWRFALAFWQFDNVQAQCLALQQQGWSVTRLLSAGWLALHGRRYSGLEDATVTEWRERVTGALRAIRQALPKADAEPGKFRAGVASLELDAERMELALAWQTLTTNDPETGDMQGSRELIRANLVAAAPTAGAADRMRPQLNTLAGTLAAFSKGDLQP